jgi:hypothetical protein
MPEYSYFCEKCQKKFEIVCSIREYSEEVACAFCNNVKSVHRAYLDDLATLNTSIKKSDTELKTIGDLANRNRDKLTEDHKQALFNKHNDYKNAESGKDLPSGMSRLKKQPKVKWT